MPIFNVKLTKHEFYNGIEANSAEEAEEIAIDYYMNDKMAFLDDKIDEIETEKVSVIKKMAKWKIVAYPEWDNGLTKQEKVIEAASREEAELKAWKTFPEYHEIGVHKVKE